MKRLFRKILFLRNKYKYDVNKKSAMAPPAEKRAPIKMAGYLEKRSKMKVVSRWKKLWFVLEGRLLTYYKSQLEYLSLSPCRGTVNMGLAASVLPGASLEIIVSTRSHTVSLRALNRSEHDVWLQALMDAMCLPNPGHNPCCTKPMHHYRYNTPESDVLYSTGTNRSVLNGHANTLGHVGSSHTSSHGHTNTSSLTSPNRSNTLGHNNSLGLSNQLVHSNTLSTSATSPIYVKTTTFPAYGTLPTKQESRLESRRGSMHESTQDFTKDSKIDKISRKFSKIAVSDTSIPGKFKEINPNESNVLRRSVSVEDEVNRLSDNLYESLRESEDKIYGYRRFKDGRRLGTKINRSDSDCLMISRERILNNHRLFKSEAQLKMRPLESSNRPSYDTFSGRSSRVKNFNERRSSATLEINSRQKRMAQNLMSLSRRGVVHSDTDLSMNKGNRRRDAPTYLDLYDEGLSTSYDFALLQELIREKRRAPIPLPIPLTKRRSNSILRKFSRAGDTSYRPRERRLSVRKRSLSFLKKFVWKRETKWELGSGSSGYDTFDRNQGCRYPEMQGPDSDLEIISDLSGLNMDADFNKKPPEPPPDYDKLNASESEESDCGHPNLPPRYKRKGKNANSSKNDSEKEQLREKDSGVATDGAGHSSNKSTRSSSPWHDVPTNNRPIYGHRARGKCKSNEELHRSDPPTLPRKTENCRRVAQDVLCQDTDPGLMRLFSETDSEIGRRRDEIGEMLHKLNDMTYQPMSPSYSLYQNTLELFEERKRKNRKAQENGEDPDYDIPRPHTSLVSKDSLAATNFFSHYEDSLDATVLKAKAEEQNMAPDSLEYDPWSLSDAASSRDSWTTPHHLLKPQPIFLPRQDSTFQDPLSRPIILTDFMRIPHHGYIYG
ncbi:Hypothetical protein NTJ_08438 [Nesidiocoris tenuis]|uniref:PH domain-containing protein n=1 Tax=Nesidiocoris tenuis TaxID=355587 RepID=A0ABN7AVR6_9HEMI|nr:Hypothetical protein NTJ_08438 [Nesidiocoris tenuis]